eukprot:6406554-Pyramimonas_sp.AAC.1
MAFVREPVLLTEVDSVSHVYRWVEHNFAILNHWLGAGSLDRVRDSVRCGLSMSTAYSGTGGAENAMHAICKACDFFFGGSSRVQHAWACEWLDESRYELAMLPDRPDHIYSDITDFLAIGYQQDLRERVPLMSYEAAESIFMKGHSKLITGRAFCVLSRSWCEARACDIHVAGTPCVAWSSMGQRARATGPTLLGFLVWAFHRLKLMETVILHENTPEFDHELLDRLLGEHYISFSCVVNASSLGQLAERTRRYTWMVHRRVLNASHAPPWPVPWGDSFVQQFHRTLGNCDWKVLFELAPQSEVKAEWDWAIATRRPRSSACFHDLLTEDEQMVLRAYNQLGYSMGAVSLTQNPDHRASGNKDKKPLH